jgi:hypothetical protein
MISKTYYYKRSQKTRRRSLYTRAPWFSLIICLLILAGCQGVPESSVNSSSGTTTASQPSTSASTATTTTGQDTLYHQKAVTWQVEQTWGMWPNTNWTAVEQDAVDLENAHITWARTNFDQGVSFAYFDRLLQIAKQHNINLLALVFKNNPANDIGTQDQRNAYKQWLASVVQRYKGDIHYWEIQDEPNGSDGWNIDNDPNSDQDQFDTSVQHFVADMQDSYETIHATDANAKVIFGGLSQYKPARFVDSMIKYNAYRYMDVMAFHPYGSSPQKVVDNLKTLQSQMATQPGFASKPIWVTEIGYHTMKDWKNNPGYVAGEQKKAEYLGPTIEGLLASGVQMIFWYTLHEDDGTNGYGLTVRSAQNPQTVYLPAYTAYKNLWS